MTKADLVLEGGGVKGIGLVGAVTKLVANGYTFERIAGTSAGAIVAAAVAAGIAPAKMRDKLGEVDRRFLDLAEHPNVPLVGIPQAILHDFGIYRGDAFRTWMNELLGNITFGDLKRTPSDSDDKSVGRSNPLYKLVVMTADVTQGTLVRLPWDYEKYGLDPDRQLVADAVRMSMSIPFFFVPVKLPGRAELFVDGGLLSNFPIDVFDRRDGKQSRWPTIGVKLSSATAAQQVPTHLPGVAGFAERVALAAINGHDRMHLDEATAKRTIFVDTQSVSAIDFDLSPNTKTLLFDTGMTSAEKFLETFVWPQ